MTVLTPRIMEKNIILSPITIAEISTTFIAQLKKEGLVLLPEKYSPAVAQVFEKRNKLMKQRTVTPYQIAKFGLLNKPATINSIKNMINDGRIGAKETYVDANGKHHVLVAAIKRLNGT